MREQSHTKALKDILEQLPKDKRKTSLYGSTESYTTTFNDIYNKEQRRLNKELGINKTNYELRGNYKNRKRNK